MRKQFRAVVVARSLVGALTVVAASGGPAGAEVTATAGQALKIAPPPSVEFKKLESNDHMFVFDERQDVVAQSDLPVDITQPGTYSRNWQLTPGVIPAGTVVRSHFVHCDRVSQNTPIVLEGTVVTGDEILGIAVLEGALDATDVLGAPNTKYPTGMSQRHLELWGQNDWVIEQIDRRTVIVHCRVSVHVDHVRIITRGAECVAPLAIGSNFNGTKIAGGNGIWFNAVAKITGAGSGPASVTFENQTVTFDAAGTPYTVGLPATTITISPSATQADVAYDPVAKRWRVTVPSGFGKNVFLGGGMFPVPAGGLPGGINPVTWSGALGAGPGISVQWKWGAAVYTSFPADPAALGVKPVDGDKLNPYPNSDHAGTPEAVRQFVIGGARGGGGSNYTGSYSGTKTGGCP